MTSKEPEWKSRLERRLVALAERLESDDNTHLDLLKECATKYADHQQSRDRLRAASIKRQAIVEEMRNIQKRLPPRQVIDQTMARACLPHLGCRRLAVGDQLSQAGRMLP